MTGINPNIISNQGALVPCRSFSEAMERHEGNNVTNVAYKMLQEGVQDLYRIEGTSKYAFVTTLEVEFADGAKETVVYEALSSNKEMFRLLGKPFHGKVSDKQARQVSIDLLKGLEVAAMTGNLEQVKALEGQGVLKVHGCKDKHLSLSASGEKLRKYASETNDKLDGDTLTLKERASRFETIEVEAESVSKIVRDLMAKYTQKLQEEPSPIEEVKMEVLEAKEASVPSDIDTNSDSDSVSEVSSDSLLSRIGSATSEIFNAHPVKTTLVGIMGFLIAAAMTATAMRSELEG